MSRWRFAILVASFCVAGVGVGVAQQGTISGPVTFTLGSTVITLGKTTSTVAGLTLTAPTITGTAAQWTPTDASGAGLSLTVTANATLTYTQGPWTSISFNITYPTTVSGATAVIGNLPIGVAANLNNVQGCSLASVTGSSVDRITLGAAGATTFIFQIGVAGAAATNVQLTGVTLKGSCFYLNANS